MNFIQMTSYLETQKKDLSSLESKYSLEQGLARPKIDEAVEASVNKDS
jgi:hypothetical protein